MWPDWVSNPGPLTYESGALRNAEYSDVEIRGVTAKVIENVRILREHRTVDNNKVDGGLQNKSFFMGMLCNALLEKF